MYYIGMDMIPHEMLQDPGSMLRLLSVMYIHNPVMFRDNADLVQLFHKMRAADANRRNMFVTRRFQSLLAIASDSRM